MSEHPAVEFLTAALARAERVARAVPRGPWHWERRSPPESFQSLEGPAGLPVFHSQAKPGNASWIELHPAFDEFLPEPEAVLRRVAAERQILVKHGLVNTTGYDAYGAASFDACGICGRNGYTPGPCGTVLLLAQAWGWTEDGS